MDEHKISALLARPGIDPEARAELLKIAAIYLRNGTAMPESLRLHLAGAFDAAAQADRSERPKVLAECLGLVGEANRARKGKLPEDLPLVVGVFGDREAELGLRQKLADECGFSKSTAKARIEETRHALSDPDGNMRKLMDDNGTSSLARKREG